MGMNTYTLVCNRHTLSLGKNTCIMGILNVTPDSFSDGGEYFQYSSAIARARQMVDDGADIIDIGGESSRPFAKAVSTDEELDRVIPVIKALAGQIPVPISIDTVKAQVAEAAIQAGASIINDISAMSRDREMVDVAVKYKVPVILMHMKGNPETMQVEPYYDDPVLEIRAYLETVIDNAVQKGIPRSKIVIDPGIGFGKTMDHNLTILKHLSDFASLGVPVLSGPSRKAFIRKTLDVSDAKKAINRVETGTQATVAASILGGAHIVRVHDVAATADTVRMIDAIKNAQ